MESKALEEYFALLEHSETYNNRFSGLVTRIFHEWIGLRDFLLVQREIESIEAYDAELKSRVRRFEALVDELSEVLQSIVINKTKIISAVSSIAAWVHRNFTPKA